AATRIKLGLQAHLYLGNLKAQRDWSHVDDTANAVLKMLNANDPDDYCVSTGETHSVEDFCKLTFKLLDMNYMDYVKIDARYLRPSEVDDLLGDSSKIRNILGWEPKYTFEMLVKEMVESDLKLAKKEKLLKDHK